MALWQQAQLGHASGATGHAQAVSSMALHLVGAAVWIGGLAVLSIGVALFLARRISRPITAVAAAAARIAEGDLSARAGLPAHELRGQSETALLALHFDKMADALEQLETERQALVADIAHELRTPLTILQGQLDAMQDGVVPFDRDELAKLDAQTELLSRLVGDLRTLSLADADRLSLHPKAFRLD